MELVYDLPIGWTIVNLEECVDILDSKRIPINSGDDLAFFKSKLEGGYNWLYLPQLFIKRTLISRKIFH